MGTLYGDWYDAHKDLFEDKTPREALTEKRKENCFPPSSKEVISDISEESGLTVEDTREWLCWFSLCPFFSCCYTS